MEAKVVASIISLSFIAWGVIGIIKPEFSYKTTAMNTQRQKPSKAAIKRYRVSGYVMTVFGIILLLLIWTGRLKGI